MKPELSTSIPTNVNLNKVRGHSSDIIMSIGMSPTTTSAIRVDTGLSRDTVKLYLRNLIRYSLVSREAYGVYRLTELGILYYTILLATKRDKIGIRKGYDRDKIGISKEIKYEQISIDPFLHEHNPSEAEAVVVDSLIANYNSSGKTGKPRPYLFWSALETVLVKKGILPDDYIEALKHLNTHGTIYQVPPGSLRHNSKIGLVKEFIAWSKNQKDKGSYDI